MTAPPRDRPFFVVVVAGTRDRALAPACLPHLRERLRSLPRPLVVVTGGAPGVDALAAREALAAGALAVATVLPNWRHLGRQAGMVRNQAMLQLLQADLVLAYPRAEERASSPGTWHMVTSARAMGLPVEVTVLRPPERGRHRRSGSSGP